MASLTFLGDFNPATEPEAGFAPIPAGEYKAAATDSKMKDTSSGGEMLSMKFTILEGEYANRVLFANFNLKNKSDDAVRIARGELAALCRAANVPSIRDSAELHNKPVMLSVGVAKRKDTGDLQNNIKGYSQIGGTASAAPNASNSAPWEN